MSLIMPKMLLIVDFNYHTRNYFVCDNISDIKKLVLDQIKSDINFLYCVKKIDINMIKDYNWNHHGVQYEITETNTQVLTRVAKQILARCCYVDFLQFLKLDTVDIDKLILNFKNKYKKILAKFLNNDLISIIIP